MILQDTHSSFDLKKCGNKNYPGDVFFLTILHFLRHWERETIQQRSSLNFFMLHFVGFLWPDQMSLVAMATVHRCTTGSVCRTKKKRVKSSLLLFMLQHRHMYTLKGTLTHKYRVEAFRFMWAKHSQQLLLLSWPDPARVWWPSCCEWAGVLKLMLPMFVTSTCLYQHACNVSGPWKVTFKLIIVIFQMVELATILVFNKNSLSWQICVCGSYNTIIWIIYL